ncbi:class I adenylate-forming enzyme family protein [Planosporangium mesophilum]|uniref:Acyl-CoA synthetase n=1 Tax=Planosporangium mesophilum TaxID=689768 RepID=A0A8J3X1V3_9ACTN|nr:AMP-binding protein [Planosporangium mesophilum]NJC85720.1 AMP-binding protein [Planosporangium mesophilum]GII24817.1 acyl-CoA synthetase [Planosporangium mesophilum]
MRPDLSGIDPLHLNLATRFCVGDLLTRTTQLFAHRTAIVDREEEISYGRLNAAAEAVGRGLLDAGVRRQEPVAFLLGNSWRFAATFFGCAKAGLVALPVNLMLPPDDIAWILSDSGTRTVVADPAFVPLLEAVLPSLPAITTVVLTGDDAPASIAGRQVLRWDDVAADPTPLEVMVSDRDTLHCLYTSGTTARPKGVLTSHLSVYVAVLSNALQVEHRRGDEFSVLPIVLPLFHTTALDTLLLPTLLTGGTVILPGGFEPDAFLELVERRSATHIVLLPMMYGALLTSPAIRTRDLSSVRLCIYAMAPMPQERIEQVAAAFPNAKVLLGSGQTECVPATVFQWPSHQDTKAASWGPSTVTVDTRIMDPSGRLLPSGQPGEIVYRGPHVMSGYWNNPAANTAAFAHGWFHSGDVGHLDSEGVVWFTDRVKDMVKTGGENVSSVEVERVLLSSPEIVEAAVIGVPDDRWGEAVTAVVVAADPDVDTAALTERLLAHCRQHLAGFQVPKRIDIMTGLPKTATGKIQKATLRQQYRA